MNIINRHQKCVGIVLFKWRQKFVQLWYCPSGYKIQAHRHPDEHIELMYLFGSATFYRQIAKNVTVSKNEVFTMTTTNIKYEGIKPKWYNIFRRFSVPEDTNHWFSVSKWPLIFINFATFKNGYKPQSAAIDFKE